MASVLSLSGAGAGGAAASPLLILDQFTDTNGTEITSHTIAPTNVPAASWASDGDAISVDIQSNKAKMEGSATTNVLKVIPCAQADVTISGDVTIIANASRQGLALRESNSTNFWKVCVRQTSNLFELVEFNANTNTVRASTSVTLTAGVSYALAAVAAGASISATLDGANGISYGSATFNQTATRHGIFSGTALGVQWDNFQVTHP